WEPPINWLVRTARRDVELCGVQIPQGMEVRVHVYCANRDPARWNDADAFDPRRKEQNNLAFSHGVHTCVGLHLAKMEMRIMVDRFLTLMPSVRLDPATGAPNVLGVTYRIPEALNIVVR